MGQHMFNQSDYITWGFPLKSAAASWKTVKWGHEDNTMTSRAREALLDVPPTDNVL